MLYSLCSGEQEVSGLVFTLKGLVVISKYLKTRFHVKHAAGSTVLLGHPADPDKIPQPVYESPLLHRTCPSYGRFLGPREAPKGTEPANGPLPRGLGSAA